MKKVTSIFLIAFIVGGCAGQKRVQSGAYNAMLQTLLSHSVPEISVDSLSKIKQNVVLLDARSPQEYKVSHIPDAKYVGYKNFDSTEVQHLNRNQHIVVYCSVGYRSEKITNKLEGMGFNNTSNLYGGIFEWKNEGHTVVSAAGPTDSVHAYSHTWGIWLKKGIKVYD